MNPTYQNIPLIAADTAQADGWQLMAGPYLLPAEGWMLDRAIADLRKGRIEFVLVQAGLSGVEVWK